MDYGSAPSRCYAFTFKITDPRFEQPSSFGWSSTRHRAPLCFLNFPSPSTAWRLWRRNSFGDAEIRTMLMNDTAV